MTSSRPFSSIELQFSAPTGFKKKSKASDLSAVVVTDGGRTLWVGSDEWTSIDRLTKIDDSTYGDHTAFELDLYLEGFDPALGEIDIEGMDHDGSYLWLIGSHSGKRKKVKLQTDEGEPKFTLTNQELKEVTKEGNRYLLARIPLVDGKLEKSAGALTVASLPRRGTSNDLTDELAGDEYLRDFITANLPGKENGLDIEGLAVKGDYLFLGLRGPVLRGMAILLTVKIAEESPGILKLEKIGAGDARRYRKHFLDLDGLGIRDLRFDGDELLLLAGPTMTLDAPFYIFRLKNPLLLEENSLSSAVNGQLTRSIEIPHGYQSDRAEGIALYPTDDGSKALLVVYDSPTETRDGQPGRETDRRVLADLFPL
ncbi:DUF3616 domain-containing protein [Pannus brasiliensis CCIBt3594]|uniref:DUF3616 domain-containing protein n=1 Tax=Pannus brasiliensis CCIBt3594 TaxID=1427578 RepID=A0AAW9QZZ0_9CHRO